MNRGNHHFFQYFEGDESAVCGTCQRGSLWKGCFYSKPILLSDGEGLAEAQNIGYAVAATFAAVTALFLTVRWTTTLGVTTCEEPGFEAGTFHSFVSSQWFCGTVAHQGHVATVSIIAAQCGIYCHFPLNSELVTCKFRERIKTCEPRGFDLGYIGILLNLRPVDRKKASIETQLPGRTRSKSLANEKELHQHDNKTCVYCMFHVGHSKVPQSKWHSSTVCRNTG